MRKYIVEVIGTFFLVLTIGMTIQKPGDAGVMAPIAIGSVLMVMIYAGGHISGGHYNPAVTFGALLRGKLPLLEVPFYFIAQCLGAAGAALLVPIVKGTAEPPVATEIGVERLLIAEVLFTFALVYVVLNVATAKATLGNSFYGLAIGFTVTTGAYAVGPVSGAAFNPAVVLGLVLMKVGAIGKIWIYLVAQFGGATIAGLLFRYLNPGDE